LGLPLSDSKLPKEAFLPYISYVEKRIGFSLDFITHGGRLTLTKSVLTSLPAYLMSCIQLPHWRKLQKTTTYQAVVSKSHHYTKMFQKTTTLQVTRNR
jgi:hypothetical protein